MNQDFNRVRKAQRAEYDRHAIHAILDASLIGHVGFVADDRPMVMPMAFARIGDTVYLHGASKTRLIRLCDGKKLCLTTTLIDAIVVARSGFNHSMNYRSAVIHGHGRAVTDPDEFDAALDAVTNHLLPGRTAEIRPMTAQERKATGVVALDIEAASAKSRTGPPVDEEADLDGRLWAGLLPVKTVLGPGVADAATAPGTPEPESLEAARKAFNPPNITECNSWNEFDI